MQPHIEIAGAADAIPGDVCSTLAFLERPGRSSDLIKAFEWASSPLGEPEFWPQSLKTAVGIVLGDGQACNLIWGPDLITFYNDAYGPLLGTIPDGIGAPYPSFRPDVWPVVEKQIMAGFAGQASTIENLKVRSRRHGEEEEIFFTLNYSPVYDETGSVGGVISHIFETTRTVLAHQALEDENSLLRRGLDHLPQMVWSTLPDGHHDFYNQPWYEFTGATPGSTDGEGWNDMFHPHDQDRAWSIWRHSLRTGEPYEIQYRLKHRDGGYRWTLGRALPERDETGKIIRWYGTCTDIHEQLLAQEKLKSLQAELIHLSRVSAMGAMASTLAHELNQPLAAIQNYASGSERMIERGSGSAELSAPIAEIGRNAARAGEIIRRLREMTRRGEIVREAFMPDAVIKEAAVLASVGAANVALSYDFRDGQAVMGDPIQIQQVVINLIRNACDAVSECDDRNVLVAAHIADDETVISVEDSGPGIPHESLSRLFDAFFSTKDDGMGVGLSISRTIVEAHGGRIWAENRPGGGARFSFTLPLAEKAAISGL